VDIVSKVHVERRADKLILDLSTAPDNQNHDLELGVVRRFSSGLGAVKPQLQQVRTEHGSKSITKITESEAVTGCQLGGVEGPPTDGITLRRHRLCGSRHAAPTCSRRRLCRRGTTGRFPLGGNDGCGCGRGVSDSGSSVNLARGTRAETPLKSAIVKDDLRVLVVGDAIGGRQWIRLLRLSGINPRHLGHDVHRVGRRRVACDHRRQHGTGDLREKRPA